MQKPILMYLLIFYLDLGLPHLLYYIENVLHYIVVYYIENVV